MALYWAILLLFITGALALLARLPRQRRWIKTERLLATAGMITATVFLFVISITGTI